MFDSVRKQKNIRYIYIIIIALYIWTIFIPFLPLNKSDNIKYLIIAGVVGPGEYLDENGDAKKASKIFTVSPFFQFTFVQHESRNPSWASKFVVVVRG